MGEGEQTKREERKKSVPTKRTRTSHTLTHFSLPSLADGVSASSAGGDDASGSRGCNLIKRTSAGQQLAAKSAHKLLQKLTKRREKERSLPTVRQL